jgi:hypothetical protein
MTAYSTNIRLKDAETTDYERLDKQMELEFFEKLRAGEYHYHGGRSLQEVTAAAYRAAHNTGKEYSFTIIKRKGGHPGGAH